MDPPRFSLGKFGQKCGPPQGDRKWMKYDKNNNSIRFLDTFYVIWPSFIHKFVFVWVLWRNKVLGQNFGSKCYVIFFRKWVLGKSMWDTYNYFFLIFQKKFKYYTPRAKFWKKKFEKFCTNMGEIDYATFWPNLPNKSNFVG